MGRVDKIALHILVFSLPFNGLRPLFNIGELSGEGFFYGSIVYAALVAPGLVTGRLNLFPALSALLKIQSVYLLCIVIFSLLNLETILANVYGARFGIERFWLSTLTYGYYFLLAALIAAHAISLGIDRLLDALGQAFAALGTCLAVLCGLEVFSWFAEPLRSVLIEARSLFAVNPEPPLMRLSGVSLEPSFNAFALLACVPWTAFRAKHPGRSRYHILTIVLIFLCTISGARTAYAGLAAMAGAFGLYKGYARGLLPAGTDGGLFVAAMFIAGIALPIVGLALIDAAAPTSNVTRAYLATAAITAGLTNPFGQGFGQATFFVVRSVAPVIQHSWELMDFYYGTRHGQLPPLYSWYARSIGEFGVSGYMLIAAGFAFVSARFFALGHDSQDRTGRALFFLGAMLLSQCLAMALSIESVRVPQFWLAWIIMALGFVTSRRQPDA